MEWLEGLNRAVEYVENNLDGTIDYEIVASIACCSSFHFQRMFSYMTGVPLSEYIRRRKMSRAALELQTGNIKIIDAALKYGYDSPTAFNRAFQTIHGISPSAARKKGVILKSFPKISFKISIKGDIEMNYKIVKKKSFRIIGVSKHFDMNVGEAFMNVPIFWAETQKSGIIPKLLSLIEGEPFGLLGVSTCMNGKDFDYYIAVATEKEKPAGTVEYTVPETMWAVFECVGAMPKAIQELQKRIVTEWLPSSGFEYADAPDIEVYGEGDLQSDNYRSEVWLPISYAK